MADVEIRPLTAIDGAAVRTLLTADSEEYRRHFHATEVDAALAEAERDRYWGVYVDRELAGIVLLRGLDAGYAAPAFGVYVAQSWAGNGLATLALAYAEAWCRANAVDELMLSVDAANDVAVRLYAKAGFAFEGEHTDRGHRIYRKQLV